ncbi:hypothetical protein ACTFIZ_001582 [Dictyostelium cf. discoideum]
MMWKLDNNNNSKEIVINHLQWRLTENLFDFTPTYCLQIDYILQDQLVKVCLTYINSLVATLRGHLDDYNNHNNYTNNNCTTTMTTTAMNKGGTLIEASVNSSLKI